MPAVDNPILRAALEYAELGWRVINVHPRTKKPVGANWQKRATTDAELIQGWWLENSEYNVGVQLGPESGLIDVECDSDDEERSLAALFGGEFPETPTFKGARGKHRLFRWRNDLPAMGDKGIVHIGEVGWRTGGGGKGAQSVFPPSVHSSGAVYKWLIHPSQAEVATVPDDVVLRITNHDGGLFTGQTSNGAKPPEYWQKILEGVSAGHRNQAAAEVIGRMLVDIRDPFDAAAVSRMWTLIEAWNGRNDPPIDARELKTTFQSILRRHRENHAVEEYGVALQRYVETPKAEAKLENQSEWRLVRVEGKPIIWHLYSPLWAMIPGGRIILPTDSLMSYRKIAGAALEQARVWLGPDFKSLWVGTRKNEGLGSKLTRLSGTEESEPEERRDAVVADILLQILTNCVSQEEPDYRGVPTVLPDGSIVFKVSAIASRMQEVMQSITFGEVVALQKECGATNKAFRTSGGIVRLKVLSDKAIESIKQIARIGPVE